MPTLSDLLVRCVDFDDDGPVTPSKVFDIPRLQGGDARVRLEIGFAFQRIESRFDALQQRSKLFDFDVHVHRRILALLPVRSALRPNVGRRRAVYESDRAEVKRNLPSAAGETDAREQRNEARFATYRVE